MPSLQAEATFTGEQGSAMPNEEVRFVSVTLEGRPAETFDRRCTGTPNAPRRHRLDWRIWETMQRMTR